MTPIRAYDFGRRDALPRVRAADGLSWESNPWGRDTALEADIRDGLELEFVRPQGVRQARLLVDARNTPWAAYLMGAFVAAHGRATQAWYDSLNTDPAGAREVGSALARETFLRVSVWASGRWEPQGLIWEAGPEIVKRQVAQLDLSTVEGDTVRVRLESVPSFWLVDRVAVAYAPQRPLTVYELRAESAVAQNGRDVRGLLNAIDDRVYVMETGDFAELLFRVPEISERKARTYLVRSTGWYRIHSPEVGDPDVALLTRLFAEPNAISRVAVAQLNEALLAMERALP